MQKTYDNYGRLSAVSFGDTNKVNYTYNYSDDSKNALKWSIEELNYPCFGYYNNERISLKLNGMSPVQYRTHSQI